MDEVQRLRQTLKAYESTVAGLELALEMKVADIQMLKRSIDGFSDLTRQQTERLRIYEGRPKIPH